jgi:uncharacterized protein YwgA
MNAAMDRPRLLVGLLNRLGHYGVETFRERLVLQKTVYLLQAFGIYLGYQFSWYLRGPYSTKLTKDAFSLEGEWSRYAAVSFANEQSEGRLRQFLLFVSGHKTDDVWLETAASAHFLVQTSGKADRDKIFAKIKAKQPYVTRRIFAGCWAELESEHLI